MNKRISEEHLQSCFKYEPARIKLPEDGKEKLYFRDIAKQHIAQKYLYAVLKAS